MNKNERGAIAREVCVVALFSALWGAVGWHIGQNAAWVSSGGEELGRHTGQSAGCFCSVVQS